ncbi:MAG: MnhB domain-containing protein [bacterium]|nr:MnhB domain-containing protein [bacterium]
MNLNLLKTGAKLLLPIFVVMALWLLLRGHNAPGGGFIAALVFITGYGLYLFAYGVEASRRILPFDPRSLIGVGLLTALFSAAWPVVWRQPFFQGMWWSWDLPGWGPLMLGTPVLFDLGVFLVVSGALMIILTSFEESRWNS